MEPQPWETSQWDFRPRTLPCVQVEQPSPVPAGTDSPASLQLCLPGGLETANWECLHSRGPYHHSFTLENFFFCFQYAKFSTICFALAECFLKISLFLYNSHNFWGLWEPPSRVAVAHKCLPNSGCWLSLCRAAMLCGPAGASPHPDQGEAPGLSPPVG